MAGTHVHELKPGGGRALLRDGGWDPLPVGNQKLYRSTVFQQDYLSISIDEAHMLRNRSRHMFSLTAKALVVLALTATPIFTNVRELASLAFTLRAPGLCCKEGIALWKEAEKPFLAAKRKVTASDVQNTSASACEVPLSIQASNIALVEFIQAVSRVVFDNNVIKRKTTSLNWMGNPLNDVRPFQQKIYHLDLREDEMRNLSLLEEADRGE